MFTLSAFLELNAGLEIRTSGGGRGVFAKERIEGGELIKTELNGILDQSFVHALLKHPKHSLTDLESLTLFFLVYLHSDSFKEYTEILPKRFKGCAVEWSLDIQALLPEYVQILIKKQRESIDRSYTHISEYAILFNLNFTLTAFTHFHCYMLVNTRSMHTGKRVILAPFVDLVNHASCKTSISESPQGLSLVVDGVFEAGEEVFIEYGRHGDVFLMVEYGFWKGVRYNREQKRGEDKLKVDGVIDKDKEKLDRTLNRIGIAEPVYDDQQQILANMYGVKGCYVSYGEYCWITRCAYALSVCSNEEKCAEWKEVWFGERETMGCEFEREWRRKVVGVVGVELEDRRIKIGNVEVILDRNLNDSLEIVWGVLKQDILILESVIEVLEQEKS